MKLLVTGAAGFIGFHVCQTLLKRGDEIVGIDNINDYYDISLKEARLERLAVESNFSFHKVDLTEKEKISVEIQGMMDKARKEIESERDGAILELKNEFGSLVIGAASKVIEKEVDDKSHSELLNKALGDKTF